jgi:WD40 repeat protein
LDGNIFASASTDLSFKIWDVRQRKACLRSWNKSRNGISAIKFMPETLNTIAVGSDDGYVRLWDLRALGKVAKFEFEDVCDGVQSM